MIVSVALPRPVDQLFSYKVRPQHIDAAQIGCRVRVPFHGQSVIGIITERDAQPPKGVTLHSIYAVLDTTPSATASLLALTRWIAQYYVCSWGEALRAALPMKQNTKLTPKTIRYLRPAPAFSTPNALKDSLQQLRGVKQQALIRVCLQYAKASTPLPPKTALLTEAQASTSTASSLIAKGILVESEEEVLRIPDYEAKSSKPPVYNAAQAHAIEALNTAIQEGKYVTFLLHGVTGSGKTEVYLAALKATLSQGKNAIVLVPEISLTPQTVRRFRARFGDRVAVLHSRMSTGERYDAWRLLRTGRCAVAIGPRSAILASMQNVGLIIVDEEHDSSYKQRDPAPRYHARDVGVMRARMEQAVCILGTATPSLETLHNARTGKYRLLTMKERVPVPGRKAAALPDVHVLDLKTEPRSAQGPRALSTTLREAIALRLERKEQVILLQNRRGYTPVWECQQCGWVPSCVDCSVSLAFHKARAHMRCHYCGYTQRPPHDCEKCHARDFAQLGTGTQRVQEELGSCFPKATVLRMDQDTTYRKNAHYHILRQFGAGEADILVGTQMVAKGLDFTRVTLVGVISADVGMGLPDFRVEEVTAQLLMQVAGRSGRHALHGEVMIQTRRPDHPIFDYAINHDYESFALELLEVRESLDYPPFGRMTVIEVRGPDEDQTAKLAKTWHTVATRQLPPPLTLLGPEPAFVARVKTKWRYHILVKSPRSFSGLSAWLRKVQQDLPKIPAKHRIAINVDAVGTF